MKPLSVLLMLFLLIACSTSTDNLENPKMEDTPLPSPPTALPDLGVAPEITNEVWINTAEPLRLQNLKGKVILLDMWTFG